MINVAVIGGGVSGIGAAWGLTKAACKVTIFEREQHLGGACSFANVPLSNGHSISIDLDFYAFNRAAFTNLAALFDELGLKSGSANQDASLMRPDGALIWYTESGQIHFVERIYDEPRFRDELARFRRQCIEVLNKPAFKDFTLERYLIERGYSDEFRQLYLYPRTQAILLTPGGTPATYPVRDLVTLWRLHGIAGTGAGEQHVLEGGMHSYAEAFTKWLQKKGGSVLLGKRVIGLVRQPDGACMRFVETDGTERQTASFDHVVVAVRSDQVAQLLDGVTAEERAAFQDFAYARAEVVVHQDSGLLPESRWGAYNYIIDADAAPKLRPSFTVYSNKLTDLPPQVPDIFVTINPVREPEASQTVQTNRLFRPQDGTAVELAAARVDQIQGQRNTWFCGSYLARPWSVEHAFITGLEVADRIRNHLIVQRRPEQAQHVDELLRHIPLLNGLAEASLTEIQTATSFFSLEADRILFRQNDVADGVYLISRGRARIYARVPGDEAIDVTEIGPGSILGEFSLLDGGRRSATAVTVEATSGLFLSLARFESLRLDGRPSAFELLDRIRIEVAHRALSVARAIASEPVLTGITALRASLETLHKASQPHSRCSPPSQVEELLAALPTLSALTSQEVRMLHALCEPRHVARGQVLADFDASPQFMFLVVRGALRCTIRRGSHVEQLLIYGPGDLAGTLSLVNEEPTHNQITAREDSLILQMQRRNFEALRTQNSGLACKLLHQVDLQLVRDLRRLNRHLGLIRAIRRFNEHNKATHV
jgi:predicted NAD/FAD-binding protein/CRP-like cAMP-binding protein